MTYSALLAILPLNLVCHLIVPQSQEFNAKNFEVNQTLQQFQPTILPNGAMAVPLANLSLQVVCKLLVTSNPSVTENGTLVENETPRPTSTENIVEENVSTTSAPGLLSTSPADISVSAGTPADEVTTTPTSRLPLPEGYVAFPEDHVAYKFYPETMHWNEARDRCIAEGAQLAIADSLAKIAHINSLPGNRNDDWVHLGIQQSNTTDEWVRIDNGLPVNPMPWDAFEPTHYGHCVSINFMENYLLADVKCHGSEGQYACEIPL